ncbi:hypothetical protein H5410_012617 [Solanum commersonii]|uniref:Uncharacterized protein n=1 Tax=Solanum commersonii TaxID=4109 RepID=A0A9J6ATC7_SOLCO|nr:hypothetical protein H5410_012617 [Solanum commersonii]
MHSKDHNNLILDVDDEDEVIKQKKSEEKKTKWHRNTSYYFAYKSKINCTSCSSLKNFFQIAHYKNKAIVVQLQDQLRE